MCKDYRIKTKLQKYISGVKVHSEQKTEDLWDVFMYNKDGYPIARDLTCKKAKEIVDKINVACF